MSEMVKWPEAPRVIKITRGLCDRLTNEDQEITTLRFPKEKGILMY